MAKRKTKATEDVTHTVEQETAVTEDTQAVQEPAPQAAPEPQTVQDPNQQQVVQGPQPSSTEEVQRAANAPVDQAEIQRARAEEEANAGYRPNVQPVTNPPLQANAAEEQLFHRINTLDARLRKIESRLAADTPVADPGPAPRDPAASNDIRPTPGPQAVATEGDTATDTTRQ